MDFTKALMVVAIFAVAIAAVNVITSISKLGKVSGYYSSPTEQGNATLIVQGTAAINFTNNIINWSQGSLQPGHNYGYLHTNYTAGNPSTYSSGDAVDGTGWANVSTGLLLDNVGSSNVSLTLNASGDAGEFICKGDVACITSVLGAPMYRWLLTPTGFACTKGLVDNTNYVGVASTGPARMVCQNFSSILYSPNNRIKIDLFVGLSGATPAGSKYSTITATASVI